MAHEFCPGYPPPYDALVASYPGTDVYPAADFRVEWGPIFHRGRLDGSAVLLVVGQDPAAHESAARRILVGVAGQRAQGLLSKLGITRSYVMVNTFLYSVYGQAGGSRHDRDPAIAAYRHRWLDAIVAQNHIDAVITLGSLAADALTAWAETPTGAAFHGHHAQLLHPTYPESASAAGQVTLAAATKQLLDNWNAAIPGLVVALTHPDQAPHPTLYGNAFASGDLTAIPEADLPAGLPDWMRSQEAWASRTGTTADDKRATLTVVVPGDQRPWKP